MKSKMERLLEGVNSERNVGDEEIEILEMLKNLMSKNFQLYAKWFGRYCNKKLYR